MATITKLIYFIRHISNRVYVFKPWLQTEYIYVCTKVADFRTELGLTFCRVQTVLNVVYGVQKLIAEQSTQICTY